MKWRKNKDWCFGLSVSKDTTQEGYSITIIILCIQVKMNFRNVLYICPDLNCPQTGCYHIRPHKKRDTCCKPERGNIINGCKRPCEEVK